jgi:formylglycine-generating enzyme required for sulfatase activity
VHQDKHLLNSGKNKILKYLEVSCVIEIAGYPSIPIQTQLAAKKFCQWLSAMTGNFYRLPTEAEWAYACRAESTTAYYFGNNEKDLDEYAWLKNNSNNKYQKVGHSLTGLLYGLLAS